MTQELTLDTTLRLNRDLPAQHVAYDVLLGSLRKPATQAVVLVEE